jgi:cell division septum initiation protein DivIVA
MSARKQDSERRASDAAADAAARLAAIVEAAEQAASKVIDDAERQAQRLLEEARERADRIVAERLRELAEELDPGAAPDVQPQLRSLEGGAEGEREAEDAPQRPGSAGARLLATQMAVSGATRAEIEQRLRSGFEIDDPGALLDAILGPED